MPLYEYRCEPCERTFEALIRTPSDAPRCPDCGSDEVAKHLSVPAAAQVQGGARGASLPIAAGPGCGAPACCGGGCDIG